jgi:tRNA A37 threonylcarbamoyladenosine synthetase subunit TsaC/SUA5/YrdC
MLMKIYPETPSARRVQQIADILRGGGVVIYPTETVNAIECEAHHKGAF